VSTPYGPVERRAIVYAKELEMPRLERLSEIYRQMLASFPCVERDTAPWQPMRQELSQSKLALVTSAGLHLRGDRPFISNPKGGDTSYRVIPATATAVEMTQSHSSIGFDRTAIYQDINVTFPIDRLRELVARGVIGSLGPNNYSFMGALRDPRGIVQETGPEVARRLKDEGVDVVFLTPT
jgi:D-proline reductase (dithiol) PrdB